jgi:hypothetical protein
MARILRPQNIGRQIGPQSKMRNYRTPQFRARTNASWRWPRYSTGMRRLRRM